MHPLYLHSFPTRRSSDLTTYSHEAKVQLFSLDVFTIEVIAIRVFVTDVVSLVFAAGGGASVCAQCEEAKTCTDRSSSRSEEHTSELQSRFDLVCRLLLEK